LSRNRKNLIFITGLFISLFASIRGFIFGLYNGTSISVYILVSIFDRLVGLGFITMILLLVVLWIQILQSNNMQLLPADTLFKFFCVPFILTCTIMIIIAAIVEYSIAVIRVWAYNTYLLFLIPLTAVFIVTLIIIGIRLYFAVRVNLQPADIVKSRRIVRRVSIFVFTSIVLLISALLSSLSYFVYPLSWIPLTITMIFTILFVAFIGIGLTIESIGDTKKTVNFDQKLHFHPPNKNENSPNL